MTLKEYINSRRKELDKFYDEWSILQETDPDDHPKDMDEQSWNEMFHAFGHK